MKNLIKTTTLSALFLLGSLSANAQESGQDEIQTLSNGQKLESGFYGGIQPGVALINDKATMEIGIRGAWIINHYFGLGLAGSSFFKYDWDILQNPNINNFGFLGSGYGGLLLKPIFWAKKPIHLAVPIMIGGGGVSMPRIITTSKQLTSFSNRVQKLNSM